MGTLYQNTIDRTAALRERGFNVEEIWEHEFNILKALDSNIQAQSRDIVDRLVPRDAFCGGRTNAIQLYYEGTAKYIDFTSLYPWVNKYCSYPIGHPQIITENFLDVDDYFGIVQCRVLPPRGLFHPVLPYRTNGKLMFPLCRTCADSMQQEICDHSDSDRTITGTWVTEEVKKAKQKGYKILKIFEVYHFDSSSTGLFKSYIDLFLKIKQEASGWPKECLTTEQKNDYISSYLAKEGVQLDADSIEYNPGRRSVAKLALNSFWGRWGMNLNKSQLTFVQSLENMNKYLVDDVKKVTDIYFPSPEIAALNWCMEEEFVPQDTSTNIFLAAFTTCHARLKLYSVLEKLEKDVLYFDTDSIIYKSNGANDPPLGNYLGEFTDELGSDTIKTFVSGGPKNYAYITHGGKSDCKVRGFSLNFKNSLDINFESIKELVTNMDNPRKIDVTNPSKITRDVKRRRVVNKPEHYQ